jgi:hypothetical protein
MSYRRMENHGRKLKEREASRRCRRKYGEA